MFLLLTNTVRICSASSRHISRLSSGKENCVTSVSRVSRSGSPTGCSSSSGWPISSNRFSTLPIAW